MPNNSPQHFSSTKSVDALALLNERIGAMLRKYRLQAGFSEEELSSQLGFDDATTVTEIEEGTRKIPLEDFFVAIGLLNIPPEDVLNLFDRAFF